LPPPRVSHAAGFLRDVNFKLGFVGEMRMWGAAPHPAKETFWKKFLWNLQKPLGQKMNESFFCLFKEKFP